MHLLVLRVQLLLTVAVMAMALVFVGSGFLVAALYVYLSSQLGPVLAALSIGALCLAGAGLVVLIGRALLRSAEREAKREAKREAGRGDRPTDAVGLALAVGQTFGGELQTLAARHRYGMMGVALVAGFALGMSPRLRRSLRGLLDG